MAKGLTPIIGLAVVVALALAAVFGAMSLTNPAFAAVGQSADAELAEKDFQPAIGTVRREGEGRKQGRSNIELERPGTRDGCRKWEVRYLNASDVDIQ